MPRRPLADSTIEARAAYWERLRLTGLKNPCEQPTLSPGEVKKWLKRLPVILPMGQDGAMYRRFRLYEQHGIVESEQVVDKVIFRVKEPAAR